MGLVQEGEYICSGCGYVYSCKHRRELAFEDWKKNNPTKVEKEFRTWWLYQLPEVKAVSFRSYDDYYVTHVGIALERAGEGEGEEPWS